MVEEEKIEAADCDDIGQDCSICFSVMAEPAKLVCGHRFCIQCIDRFFGTHEHSCPMCRKKMSAAYKPSIDKVF